MANWYPEAIEALKYVESPKAFLYEVAKKNPKAIVDASKRIRGATEVENDPLIQRTIDAIKARGMVVDAVKMYRTATGASLKDAVEYVRSIKTRYGL